MVFSRSICIASNSNISFFFYNSNISLYIYILGASLIAQVVKNLPAMQETQVRFLGWEDPLEKEMAIHSSILVWKILWTEEPGGLQSMESQELDTTERLNHHHHHTYHISLNQLSVDEHLDCFHVLAIINSAAMNICMHLSFELKFSFFLDIWPGVGLLDHMAALFLVFLRNFHPVFYGGCTHLRSHQ